MARKDYFVLVIVGTIFILIGSIPYYLAFQNAGGEHQFGGFLLNPIDGNSYLAKMYQGWLGSWKFSLPYSHQPGTGGYLFLFYLALGHITRFIGGSLLSTFHSARIIGSALLVISLWIFFYQILPSRRAIWLAFLFALFGSGLGWLAASFGLFTADFWVAEGFPFLAAYANPHFPLGIALMVWILTPNNGFNQKVRSVYRFIPEFSWFCFALFLAIILPFGVVVAGTILGGYGFWKYLFGYSERNTSGEKNKHLTTIVRDSESWWKLIFVLSGGLPVMIYTIWVTQSNPELAAWSAQNITAAPPIWDLLISFSPVIFIASIGGYLVWKRKSSQAAIILIWAVLALLLLYFPWNLQRRFIMGYMIPLAGLAAIGLDYLFERSRMLGTIVAVLAVFLILPTNLMILVGGFQAVISQAPKIMLHNEEVTALEWIAANTNQDALVLASPQMGLYIPAYTGRRVLYGHPFETIDAKEMEDALENFYLGEMDISDLPAKVEVNYIFYGPREQGLGNVALSNQFELVYSSDQIRIYKVAGDGDITSVEEIQ